MSVRTTVDPARIPADALEICKKLDAMGHGAWVVGGCVRDHLMGRDVSDWDICTSAAPQIVMKAFPRVIPTGVQHGTVTVLMNKTGYEVTTLRGETTYSDGRRPDAVHFVEDIRHDLARRDFTVNAIAYDPLRDTLIDPFDGIADLRARVIRAVGDPDERFGEDGLRVLRAARFVATLTFDLDPRTQSAIGANLATFRKVSAERVRDEWVKTLKAAQPSRAFEVMRHTGILEAIDPGFMPMVGCIQEPFHRRDVWQHALATLNLCPPNDPILRMAALVHDAGKPAVRAVDASGAVSFPGHAARSAEMAEAFLKRYRFSNDERHAITHLVRHHDIEYVPTWTDGDVRRFIVRVGRPAIAQLFALRRANLVARDMGDDVTLAELDQLRARIDAVIAAKHPLSTRDLAIDGGVLQSQLGIPPSRKIGEIMAALLERALDDPSVNVRERLLDLARALNAPPG